MSNQKKIIVMSSLVLLLAVTAIFNFVFANTNAQADAFDGVTTANYFTTYRTERTTTRNEELMQLDSILASAEANSIEHSEALSMKIELTAMTEKEMLLENLIKAYGFEDVVVVIGLESDNINVIAKSSDLTTEDAITIYSIIAEETGATPENVKIIPIS